MEKVNFLENAIFFSQPDLFDSKKTQKNLLG